MNIPISYQWLKSHFEKDIPSPEEISELFMKHLCEVEDMEKKGGDTIFDLKILPDRGHDLLAHFGIANEVAVLSGIPLKQKTPNKRQRTDLVATLRVSVAEAKFCPRYMGRVFEGVKVGKTPEWLRARLESVGQRSINNVVDITNYVMLELGQPMHAFDANKLNRAVDGALEIVVRRGENGETMTTLDDKEILLTSDILVIADTSRVLAIAGVKGGKDAGVDENTTSIVLEAANFNAVNTRKTSAHIGIRTDSSKRFEHEISIVLAERAMDLATELFLEIFPEAKVGEVVDVYPKPEEQNEVSISLSELNGVLGTTLSKKEVIDVLLRLGFMYREEGERIVVMIPFERLDLRIKEDLAEEIGRVYGFDKIVSTPIPDIAFTARPLNVYYYSNLIRDTLAARGFSEVYTYSFQNNGVFAVANPIAEDKSFLRKDLATGLSQALVFNARNAPLLGLDEIKIFEIGKVFPRVMEEKLSCAIGIGLAKTDMGKDALTRAMLESVRKDLSAMLGVAIDGIFSGNIFEFKLGALVDELPLLKVGEPFKAIDTKYEKPSAYPFVLRDIAMWAKEGIHQDEILSIIHIEAEKLLVRGELFDVFTKDFDGVKKNSYAFNLVFQSYERTLSDSEVNEVMVRVMKKLSDQGFDIR